jgi:hypothetical protein
MNFSEKTLKKYDFSEYGQMRLMTFLRLDYLGEKKLKILFLS